MRKLTKVNIWTRLKFGLKFRGLTEFLINNAGPLAVSLMAIMQTMLVVACAKGGGDGAPAAVPYVAVTSTVGTGPLAIPSGSTYRFYAQNSKWATYLKYMGYTTSTSATLTLNSSFKTILSKAMGVCDTNDSDSGVYDCSNWLNSGYHDIGVEFSGANPNMAKVIIRSYPSQDVYYGASWSLPSFGDMISGFFGFGSYTETQATYNPMVINMSGDPINDSAGFQLTSYGPNWSKAWNKQLMIVVDSGTISDSSINFKLQYKKVGEDATTVASGVFNRCQTQNCGF